MSITVQLCKKDKNFWSPSSWLCIHCEKDGRISALLPAAPWNLPDKSNKDLRCTPQRQRTSTVTILFSFSFPPPISSNASHRIESEDSALPSPAFAQSFYDRRPLQRLVTKQLRHWLKISSCSLFAYLSEHLLCFLTFAVQLWLTFCHLRCTA